MSLSGQKAPKAAKPNTPTSCTVEGKTFNPCPPGLLKQAQREQARSNSGIQSKVVVKKFAGLKATKHAKSPLATSRQVTSAAAKIPGAAVSLIPPTTTTMTVGQLPDYFGIGNFANSPLPQLDANGNLLAGTGIRKFVDTLPGLCSQGTNNLGQCIPLAVSDTTTFPGADFYRIGLSEYRKQLHSDLPSGSSATSLRGYVQLDASNNPAASTSGQHQYFGPMIIATRNRPVRMLFKNSLATDLTLPVDTTFAGAGLVDDGTTSKTASLKRSNIHLHGGNTPWISDGTPHQWTTPAGGDGQPARLGFSKGVSTVDVPDMVAPKCVGAQCVNPNPSLTDGMMTLYFTNQQSGRMLWYHDHTYATTRLSVQSGEAAPYLIVDPAQETALKNLGVPGTIITDPVTGAINTADWNHVMPLVIQDKTFVPDNGQAGGQLAATDPTWDVAKWGGLGSLWIPHVWNPNQNPADVSGANGWGRWDYGAWFWPAQDPSTYLLRPIPCNSAATPATGWAFPPLLCPGFPDPSQTGAAKSPTGTPENFADTALVNGTAYPRTTVEPTAYRFHILNASDARALNLGLYLADPLTISLTSGGDSYAGAPANPPVVTVNGCTSATAVAVVDGGTGSVVDIQLSYPNGGPGCTGTPTVTIAPPPNGGTQAAAFASVDTEVRMTPNNSAAGRNGLPNCSTAQEPVMDAGGLIHALLDSNGNPLNGTGLPSGCWPLYNSLAGFSAVPLGEQGNVSWGNSDGRIGGIPDPRVAGPPIIQIGAEGGLLPTPSVIPSTPISYDYNKRAITVLSVLNHGLMVGPAERADIIVDFSAFAGKKLILYNDNPAPMPAQDPRLDYFTNDPDQSDSGGAPTTIAGYGPNTRTIMQFVVGTSTSSPNSFSLPALTAAQPALFASTQHPNIIPEPPYPAANGQGDPEYARISDTSLTTTTPNPVCPTASLATPCAIPMQPKTIQELFTADYGRMNATLGVELPFTNFLTQTTIPYGYNDPPTEIFKDGETQVWKITHNGVDTHFIHFHLFDVQVINRVGWDGQIKLPDDNELGSKDTVRMNPLEDIVVALRPMKQATMPFDIPNSIRPLDPTHPVGYSSSTEYTNQDPSNHPAAVVNDLVNFGWEYVWHCHILGHEENDMMRAMIMAVAPNAPAMTTNTVAKVGTTSYTATLHWTQPTITPNTGFTMQRSTDPAFPTVSTTTFSLGNTVNTYANTGLPTTAMNYYYRINANNLVGYTRPYAPPATGYPHVSADSAWSSTVVIPVNMGRISVSPAGPLSFSTLLGLPSATQVVTVTNTGSAAIAGLATTLNGTNAAEFVKSTTCTTALAVNASCTVTMYMTPATNGAKTAALAVVATTPVLPVSVSLTGTALSPGILSFTPSTMSFAGSLGVTSASQVIAVSNTGAGSLGITSFVLGGTNANQFATTNNCGVAVAPGANCSLIVTFTPTTSGAKAATLALTTTNGTGSVTLSGTVAIPVLTLSPVTLSVSSNLNAPSATQTVTVSNTGNGPMSMTGITLGGTNANQFTSTNNCPLGTNTLAAGTTCTVSLVFTPTTIGNKTASLSVAASALTTGTVALTGTVNPPVLSVTGGPLAFSTTLNVRTAAQALTVTNNGGSPLTLTTIAFGTTNATQYAQTTTCVTGATGALAAGASCTVSVTFLPTTVGAKAGTLVITPATPAAAVTATLAGTVLVPVLSLSPATLTVASNLNVASATQSVTVSNTGTAALSITGITLTGTNANQFTISNNPCGISLAAGANCLVSLVFTPSTVGNKTASLSVAVAAPATTGTVALTGTVNPPVLSVAGGPLSFSTVLNVRTAVQALTVTNNGGSPLTLTTIAFGTTNATQYAQTTTCVTGATGALAAGASCTVSVTFLPTTVGAKAGTLVITPATPATAVTTALTGTVLVPALTITGGALSYSTTLNTPTAAGVFTVSNTGTAALSITGVSFTGTGATSFTQTNSCPASVAAGASCNVNVVFNPATVGAKAASLSVAVTAPAVTGTVALTGTVLVPVLVVTPTTQTFLAQTRGTLSAARVTTISNATGTAPLSITSIALAGTNPTYYSIQSNTCGSTLAVGASCTVGVSFYPPSAGTTGTKPATLAITVGAPATSVNVTLTGTAQ